MGKGIEPFHGRQAGSMEESVYQILTGRGSPCEMKYARPAMALPGVSRFAASRWARAALSTNVESTRLSPDPPSIKRLATHRLRWWEKLGIAWAPDQMRSKRHGRETVAVGLDHEAFGCGFSGQVRRQIFLGRGSSSLALRTSRPPKATLGVLVYTSRTTPLRRHASMTLRVPVTLAAWYSE